MLKYSILTASLILTLTLISFRPALAGDVMILSAEFRSSDNEHWSIKVTLKHDDTGWEHYADNWRIVDSQGNILGNRVLYHPHVDEQPFTRSLSNVQIPKQYKSVYIEAHDKVHGWTAKRLKIDLEQSQNGDIRVRAD